MFTAETRIPQLPAPPVVAVPAARFAQLGLIKVAQNAVKAHGDVVTLSLPDGKDMTMLASPAHATFWQQNPNCFCKDVDQSGTGAALTRSALGLNLLTAADGADWREIRKEMTALLGSAKPWFHRPLRSATERLIADMTARPDVPLLEHCLRWSTTIVCDALLAQPALETPARDLVQTLNDTFVALVLDPQPDTLSHAQTCFTNVMGEVLDTYGPDSIADKVLADLPDDATRAQQTDHLQSIVGGLLVASLHINALSLFWALVQIADRPDIQQRLRIEATPHKLEDRRIAQTPLALAVTQESQRLRPVMAFIERQVKVPVNIDGFALKSGDTVLFSPWFAQRNTAAWEDAATFDPNRFISGAYVPDGRYFPFGLGPRMCPGSVIVKQQITYALSAIALHLDLSPCPDTRPGDIAPLFRINLEPRGSVSIRATAI